MLTVEACITSSVFQSLSSLWGLAHLQLVPHVNILRQSVCICPLTGFLFSCLCRKLSLVRILNYVDLWWKVCVLAHLE